MDRKHSSLKVAALGGITAALSVAALLTPMIAQANPIAPINELNVLLGNVIPQYTIVSVGPSTSFMINSGPVVGKMLVGGGNTNVSGSGNNQCSTPGPCNNTNGTPLQYVVSGSASGNNLTGGGSATPVPIVTNLMDGGAAATTAFNDAAALSAFAAGLPSTQAFSNMIVGNGGLNVINVSSISSNSANSPRISGGPDDIFVFNVSGNISFGNASIPTLVGISPSQILFNLTSSSGNCFSTSGGSAMQFGTFLATNGCNFQFSNLGLTGQLINTGGHIQLVSGSSVNVFAPFAPPAPPEVPEPATWALFLAGGAGLLLMWNRKRARGPSL